MSDANGAGAGNNPAGEGATGGTGQPAAAGTEALLNGNPAGAKPPEGAAGGEKVEDDSKGTKTEGEIAYDFEMPEGVELDTAGLEEFKGIAKELKLPADAAKKIVALEAKRVQAQMAAHEKMTTDWASEAAADKDYGGEAFDQNMVLANKALTQFGSDKLKEYLKVTKLGNHPELIRLMVNVGKSISEDGFVKAGATTGTPKSIADVFYDTK